MLCRYSGPTEAIQRVDFSLLCLVRRTHLPANGTTSNEHHGQACFFRASFNWIPLTYCPLLLHGTVHPPSLSTAPSSSGPAHSTPFASLPHLAPRPRSLEATRLRSSRPLPQDTGPPSLQGRQIPPSLRTVEKKLSGRCGTCDIATLAAATCDGDAQHDRPSTRGVGAMLRFHARGTKPQLRQAAGGIPVPGGASYTARKHLRWKRRGTWQDVTRDACTWEKIEAKGPEEKRA